MTKLFYPNASSMTVRLGYPLPVTRRKKAMTTKAQEPDTPFRSEEDRFRWEAMEEYCGDDIQIDSRAEVSLAVDGAWVAAWVFVQAEEEGED